MSKAKVISVLNHKGGVGKDYNHDQPGRRVTSKRVQGSFDRP